MQSLRSEIGRSTHAARESHLHFEVASFATNACFGTGLRMPAVNKSVPLDHIRNLRETRDSAAGCRMCSTATSILHSSGLRLIAHRRFMPDHAP